MSRKTVLFFGEAVTLAHVARPYVLASALDSARFRVEFAVDPRYDRLFPAQGLTRRPLWSVPTDRFLSALRNGSPLYDSVTLERYVEDDIAVIDAVQPDLIVGDFRLSLSVSARVAGVPYATLSNAYWSPFARQRFPVPELPLTRLLGARLGQPVFDLVRPLAFALHTRPLNRVRQRHGLADLGLDLRRTYTDADQVLYADLPGLVDMAPLPDNHAFIGPVLWSPSGALPHWWAEVGQNHPLVYVNLGSSGRTDLLPRILLGLQQTEVFTIAATAGRGVRLPAHPRLRTAPFLPGDAVAQIADLVICNGGSPSTQQALAHGRPVLGIPVNLDQHLNMQCVERLRAGRLMRSDQLTSVKVADAVVSMLSTNNYGEAALSLRDAAAQWDSERLFRTWVGGRLT